MCRAEEAAPGGEGPNGTAVPRSLRTAPGAARRVLGLPRPPRAASGNGVRSRGWGAERSGSRGAESSVLPREAAEVRGAVVALCHGEPR